MAFLPFPLVHFESKHTIFTDENNSTNIPALTCHFEVLSRIF